MRPSLSRSKSPNYGAGVSGLSPWISCVARTHGLVDLDALLFGQLVHVVLTLPFESLFLESLALSVRPLIVPLVSCR